jgi:hypothetical protein
MPSSWIVVEPSLPALTFTYSFGPGVANSLAVAVDGGLAVVSPPSSPPESAFTELEKHGKLRAIVAPNAFHTMGIAPWKARFPDVPVFAPQGGIARVEKQSKVSGIRPIAEASSLLGGKVEMIEMPHFKQGEILVRWPIEGGYAWYVTDILFNMPELPKGPFGYVMKWSRSAPGLRRNWLSGIFALKDKRAFAPWLAAEAEKTPPKLVIACHGDLARLSDPAAEIRAALS